MAHPITELSRLNYDLLSKELKPTKEEKEVLKFKKAYDGDYWQNGAYILLPEYNQTDAAYLGPRLKKRYVTRNVIREVVERMSNAILGKSPNWLFEIGDEVIDASQRRRELRLQEIESNRPPQLPLQPEIVQTESEGSEESTPPAQTDSESARQIEERFKMIDSLDKLLGNFWTNEGVADKMISAFESRLVSSRGGLRIYIPRKHTQEGSASADDLKDALGKIKVEFIESDKGRLLLDDDEKFSIVLYERRVDWETNKTVKVIEFSFVDNDNRTFIGVINQGEEIQLNQATPENGQADASGNLISQLSDPLMLGGATTFNELSGDRPFVTDQLFQNNQLLNLALTCGGFNLVDSGFGEMVLTNVELEMETYIRPDGTEGRRPKHLKRGGGAVNNFVGISTQDMESGEEKVANPGVHFREPSSMQVFVDGSDLAYAKCLDEAGQKFALISGDAAASGEARIQAMVDFYLKVKKYKPEIDRFGSWLLTTVVKLAAMMTGQTAEFEDFQIIFDSKIVVAKLTPDERRLVIEMKEKGIISLETCRVLLDIDDPDLEQDLIDQEKTRIEPMIGGQAASEIRERVGIANSLTGTADLATRLRMTFPNLSEEQIQAMIRSMTSEDAVLNANQEI